MLRLPDRSRPVILFLAKMLACYIAWFALYDLWLYPDGRLIAAVAEHAAVLSAALLDVVGAEVVLEGRTLWLGNAGVVVADDCTGLSTVGLFLGFVLAFPGSAWRRALFLPLGVLAIHAANVVRIAVLAVLRSAQPELFDAAHEWGLLPFFYTVVFALWMVWAHVGTPAMHPETRPVGAATAG